MLYDLYFNHELLEDGEKFLEEGLHERDTESLLYSLDKHEYVVIEKLLSLRSYCVFFEKLYKLICKDYNNQNIDRVNRTIQQLNTAIERLNDRLTELKLAFEIINRLERIKLECLDLTDEEFIERIALRSYFCTFVGSCTSFVHAFIHDIELLRDKVVNLSV